MKVLKIFMKINGLQNYDPFERPIENVSQPLRVKVRMLLNHSLDIVRFAFLFPVESLNSGRKEPANGSIGLR